MPLNSGTPEPSGSAAIERHSLYLARSARESVTATSLHHTFDGFAIHCMVGPTAVNCSFPDRLKMGEDRGNGDRKALIGGRWSPKFTYFPY